MTSWFPMELANRDGYPFIWLRRLQTNVEGELRYSFEVMPLTRHKSTPASLGYWVNAAGSIPDSNVNMSRGWWCHMLPLNPDGTIKLPEDFYTAKLPGQE